MSERPPYTRVSGSEGKVTAEQPSVQALVERVRRGFAEYGDDTEMVVSEADAALDSLQGHIQWLKAARSELAAECVEYKRRVQELEAEIRSENKWPGERKHGGWEYKDRA